MSVTRKKSTLSSSTSLTKLNTIGQNNTTNRNRKNLTKPGWDSTHSNLEQLKATQEEIVSFIQ
jgi:hypothetical protein